MKITKQLQQSIGILCLCIGIGAVMSCGSKDRKIPVEDFFSTPDKTNFRISPNGEFISYLKVQDDYRNIQLIHIDEDMREIKLTNQPDPGIQNYFWADDDELIFMRTKRRNDSLQVMAVNRQSKATRHLLPPSTSKLRWIFPNKVKNNTVLVSLNERDPALFDVYRLSIDACHKELIAENPGNIIRWYADLQGELRLALASDSVRETMLYRDSEQDQFMPVTSNSFRNTITPLGFSKSGRSRIYALSNIDRDKLALVEFDLATGQEVQVLYTHEEVDVNHAGYSLDRGEMAYARYTTWKGERHFLDPYTENIYSNISQKLEGYELQIIDRDADRKRYIVNAYTDSNPGAIYYFEVSTGRLIKLQDNNPTLKDRNLAPMRAISYTTRDGQRIHGYLTLPKKATQKKVPIIVFPHNGPSDRDIWHFQPDVQFFVNRGYGVFQVNYRGSTGYGKAFWAAGFKEWGGKIQEDISDGVDWLIAEGIADSSRIGIYGVGFGGYSALHAACFNSHKYRCAASYSGFTNLFTYLREIPPYLKPYLQMYYEIIGNPEQDSEMIKHMSPVFHSDKIDIPVFIAQGGKDSKNSNIETNQFIQKLKKRNIPVTYILHDEEGRYFGKEENKINFYRELEVFFDTHLK